MSEQIEAQAECRSLKKGDIIKKAGESFEGIYFIEKGVVRGYEYQGERPITFWFKKENEFILPLDLIGGKDEADKDLEMELLEDGVLWVLPGSVVSQLLKEFAIFHFHISELGVREIIVIQLQVRLEREKDASRKYDYLSQQKPDLFVRVSAAHLASFMGISEKEFLHLHKSELHLPHLTRRHRKRKK